VGIKAGADAWGQFRKSDSFRAKYACPSTADMRQLQHNVGFVPRADIMLGLRMLPRLRDRIGDGFDAYWSQFGRLGQALPCVRLNTFFSWATACFAPGVWFSSSRVNSSSSVTRVMASSIYSKRLGSRVTRIAA
jgi:hypothetical protein